MFLLKALLLSVLAAAVSADFETTLNGHRVVMVETNLWPIQAAEACEKDGARLLTLCSGQELKDLRTALADYNLGIKEFWIGLRTPKPSHGFLTLEEVSDTTGDQCRVLSNWGNRPWTIYSKICLYSRFYICEYDEPSDECPEIAVEPVPEIVEPEVVPEIVEPVPEILVEPVPEILVEPTVQPEIVEPEVVVDPTEPQVIATTEAEVVEETCVKERGKFSANGLSVDIAFEEGSCKFMAKQCNAEKCFCVNSKSGKRSFGNLEVPLGQSYDCSKKPGKCQVAMFSATLNGDADVPSCDESGGYSPKQCSASACWCVKANGKRIKKTKTKDKDGLTC